MNYELIDSGEGRRLERFGKYILDRPDPEVMWSKNLREEEWKKADAKFIYDNWITKPNFSEKWLFEINNLKVNLKLTPFKHVGIFPEQEFEWNLISKSVKTDSNILNLFAYTGIASLHALEKGAKVTHVDASRPAISWFNENLKLNNLEDKPVRFIPEDCLKFVEREIKRGTKYDGIIMDPPVYGHGPHGETWSFSKNLPNLLDKVLKLLSDTPLFVIINAYAVSTSPTTLANMLQEKFNYLGGEVTSGELTLKEKSAGRTLSTGIWAMWQK
ncbi:hypothetical protein A2130_03085 [Candidatus Woesebacteria bacterium GWC2_33_12]|nr:MAG: hypothetical protein UR29_C0023G0002 [Candidatus Woesebacteria bacterium GW2011_GWC2_33_12]KKP41357.1 MAG: hypothetical protein UR33_C0019G0002 [Candidatus Woesebacteria bacterium GW2011_GWA2_33_20]OGM07425.1 MAG: hypothetical protein A2130_03085 [Candidatus Woesebacteria bacterium GWC2_33_12]OGM78643.1 MAG: hypothetical protein A2366_02835 [Candidatus Woesebacteria bacterium RIFOXYB1_FULL_33_9]HCR36293.1 SAM-dependent methyltransferase [Candidatus Woesebacteria bacterium]